MKLTGKVAIVTGGASGIGRATSVTLAGAGAHVFIGDVNRDKGEEAAAQIRQNGGKAEFLPLDVCNDDSIKTFADTVIGRHGKADIVVNSAGWDVIEPFWKNTPEYWDKVVALNYMGAVKVIRAFIDPMMQAKSGKIVNVASDAGRVGSMGEAVYAGAKGGVIAFTKSMARELARYSVCVNCVCPGPTDTPLLMSQPEKMREAFMRAIPLGRFAKPEEIADTVLFFSSSRSDYITGQVLSVSGGLTMAG